MFFSWINRVRTILPKNFQRASRQHAAMANSWNYIRAWHTEYRSTKTVVYEPLAKMHKIGVDYTMAATERRSPARAFIRRARLPPELVSFEREARLV
jgi:hypothetical protein